MKKKQKEKTCIECGDIYQPRSKQSIYCSNKCRSRYHNNKNKEKMKLYRTLYEGPTNQIIQKKCSYCKTKFESKNKKRVYCSAICRKAFHRKNSSKYAETAEKYKKSLSRKESLKKYNSSDKNKIIQARYRKTEAREKSHEKYYNSDKRISIQSEYKATERYKKLHREGKFKKQDLTRKASDGTATVKFHRICKKLAKEFWIKEGFKFRSLDLDHIVPISKGGKHSSKNCLYIPSTMNRKKGAKDPKLFFESVSPGLYKKIKNLIKKINKELSNS